MEGNIAKKIENGVLIWITGLPGSGKTTLAKNLYNSLKNKLPIVSIDGDTIRKIMGNDLGHNTKDRLSNAYRIAKLNKHLIDHNLTVICSTVSLFSEIHQWNRENIKKLIEIYIDVPMETLINRDQKKIYSQAVKGKLKNVRGFDQSFDLPKNPDLVIKNTKDIKAFLENTDIIIELIIKKLKNEKYEK
ncbi:MAG: adenylyl-sulfate kinase [Parcubacteria group bacterium]|nr:adenylyl-sulfate kinase [Parcubacteria group bacterium]